LECRSCKNDLINPYLNPRRTRDQHREAGERRRLYGLWAGEEKIDSDKVYRTFQGKCFKCGKELSKKEAKLDHTLPVRLLWPLKAGPTLLCDRHNNEKHDKWPSEYYNEKELRKLSILTGIPYGLLSSEPTMSPQAVTTLLENADEFLVRWARYPDEIKKIRRLVLEATGQDLYECARVVPSYLTD